MRLDGWEVAALDLLTRHASAPYEAGVTDCWQMACETVAAITGRRPYAGVTYRTDAGAAKAMRKRGFSTPGAAMAAHLPERPAGHAMRGDIAVIPTEAGDTLGVVWGAVIMVRVGHALEQRPLSAASRILAVD